MKVTLKMLKCYKLTDIISNIHSEYLRLKFK